MTFWTLILGLNSPFLSRVALGLLLLAFLVSGLAALLLGTKLREIAKKRRSTKQTPMTVPIPFASRMERIARSASKPTLLLVGVAIGAVIGGPSGWLWRDHQEIGNTVQVLNAVVEQQNGLTVVYHYLDDPAETQHAQLFCAEPSNRVPHFKPRQIIASMELVRRDDCEVAKNFTLRRVNGVALLAGGIH